MAPLIRVTILVKKVDHLSHEEFNDYWSNTHPHTFLSVPIVQRNIRKYSQFHVDHATSDAPRAHGLPIAEYDGGVNFWGESVEALMAVFEDDEYKNVVIPDEEKFLKRSVATMMIGWDEDTWVDGKAVVEK